MLVHHFTVECPTCASPTSLSHPTLTCARCSECSPWRRAVSDGMYGAVVANGGGPRTTAEGCIPCFCRYSWWSPTRPVTGGQYSSVYSSVLTSFHRWAYRPPFHKRLSYVAERHSGVAQRLRRDTLSFSVTTGHDHRFNATESVATLIAVESE